MKVHEKLKVMRQCKNWTQEEIADKLGWAVNSYAKIERGEVDIKLDKLEKFAELMGIDVQELIDPKEGTVFNFAENRHCSTGNTTGTTIYNLPLGSIVLTESQCAHQLEKANLIIEQQAKEINWLKEEIDRFKEIVALLKQVSK